jgi:hypothetical protein
VVTRLRQGRLLSSTGENASVAMIATRRAPRQHSHAEASRYVNQFTKETGNDSTSPRPRSRLGALRDASPAAKASEIVVRPAAPPPMRPRWRLVQTPRQSVPLRTWAQQAPQADAIAGRAGSSSDGAVDLWENARTDRCHHFSCPGIESRRMPLPDSPPSASTTDCESPRALCGPSSPSRKAREMPSCGKSCAELGASLVRLLGLGLSPLGRGPPDLFRVVSSPVPPRSVREFSAG